MAITRDQKRPSAAPIWSFLNDATFRSIVYQLVTAASIILFFWWVIGNTTANMAQRNMSAGFDFLNVSAGFGISFTLIPYREGDSYLRVFQVGIANTLLVAIISIIFATVLGLFVGLARLSSNWLIRTLARSYVEVLRNTPLLLQIIAWFFGVFNLLPRPRDSIVWLDVFALNNRGFYMPAPLPEAGFNAVLLTLALAIVAAVYIRIWAKRRQDATGQIFPSLSVGAGLVFGLPLVVFLALGQPLSWEIPELRGFNFQGGLSVPPSFCALVIALSVYTSCFIAEIVRSGIQSVSRGQTEAAKSLNIKPNWTMRLIVLPQALRVIVPPLISQYLNVTKNSSLAIAIGFPDLVSVWMNTSLNQSGRAIPIVAMTMAFYCAASLFVSLLMNAYNRRILLKER
ncbi:MAG: amino acid ABC transporter permease [Geminicoccaceae bacterium]|nr:MAG: amino acid ABC transporter permease [Geminicoccaceae bacterium]